MTKKVGPGFPPEEYKWKKGCPSPNPSGRPPTAQRAKMLRRLEPFDELVLRLGNLPARMGDDTVSLSEVTLRKAYELALDSKSPDTKLLVELIRLNKETSEARDKLLNECFAAAQGYKEHWSERILAAKRAGRSVPRPVPHPDDIILRRDRTVDILGPTTPEEQKLMLMHLKKRKLVEDCLKFPLRVGEGDELVKLFRRRWNAANKHLPPRLQKPWPGIRRAEPGDEL